MSKDIKTKTTVKDIKALDKAVITHDKIRNVSTKTKDSIDENQNSPYNNPTDYATNRVSSRGKQVADRTAIESKVKVKQGIRLVKDKRAKHKEEIDIEEVNSKIKTRQAIKKDIKTTDKNKTSFIKNRKSSIKKNNSIINKLTPQDLAKKSAIKNAQEMKEKARITKQFAQKSASATKKLAKASKNAVARLIQASKSTMTLLCSIGSVGLIVIILIALIGGIFMTGSSNSGEGNELSQAVIEHTPTIQKYADEYKIGQFTSVLQAIMMQESGGEGNDPMQSSECSFNEKFEKKPNGITDPDYSIKVGVQNFADCLSKAKCTDPLDMPTLSLALQGYNFGNGYIEWAIKNFGAYSQGNAQVFSDEKAREKGWDSYGDVEYVAHVLRYYQFSSMGSTNSKLVNIALSQVGNKGGAPYWSWYGYKSRVEWCACFVSYVANQSGDLDKTIPKFSAVKDGIKYYKDKSQWRDKGYVPKTGDLIFFDWQHDGTSDHVGIVEKVENNIIYTVEGNSNDECKQNKYSVNSNVIYGFGLPSK